MNLCTRRRSIFSSAAVLDPGSKRSQARGMATKKKRPASKQNAAPKAPKAPSRKVLYAPWRLEFILGPKAAGCFLCEAARLPAGDEAAWKRMLLLHRDEHALVIMNRYPYTGGHLLIAPHRHTADLPGLNAAESSSLWELTRASLSAVNAVLKPQGHNVGMNLGRPAGAGVEDHLHMHVIPRWVGDTNFLPVVGGAHTIPMALEDLWEELRPKFRAL